MTAALDPVAPAEPPANGLFWSQLESTNYSGYIARLRQVGCPEQTVRDIVIADICHLYAQEWKRRFLAARPNYWDPEFGQGLIQSDEIQAEAAQVQEALRENVRQLLGVNLEKELEKYRAIGSTHLGTEFLLSDVLPPGKAAPAATAVERYNTTCQEVENLGFVTAEGVAAVAKARQRLERELSGFLTTEEVAQVAYRCSTAAQEVRDRLAGFAPLEGEFKELFARRSRSRDQFESAVLQGSAGQPLEPDEILKLGAQAEIGDATLAAVLGAERYAEFERSQDPRYRQLQAATARDGISSEWVKSVYDGQRQAEARVRAIRENPALDSEAKEAMAREATMANQEQLRAWLGDELMRKLQTVLPGPR